MERAPRHGAARAITRAVKAELPDWSIVCRGMHPARAPQKPPVQTVRISRFLGKRRVVSFGWRYDYASRALCDADPIPAFLLALRSDAVGFAGVSADSLQQILVNEYAPGGGIGWHRDRGMFSDVIAVSLSAPAILRLRRRQGNEWDRASRTLQPRSAYLLRGAARWEWQHSIPPVDALRYPVTFRKLAGDDGISPCRESDPSALT
jgi:alkylated DNA repair dioxygenase AlkB